jgi:hypothetical protein
MKTLKSITVIALILHAHISFAGRERSGDWGHAEDNLSKISFELASQLSSRTQLDVQKYLFEPPNMNSPLISLGQVTNEYVSTLIENVRFSFREEREGRFLFWGFDNGGPYIEALEFFYIAFGDMPLKSWSPQRVMEVRARLLKEASHVWGYDDNQGKEFAKNVLQDIYPHVSPDILTEKHLTEEEYLKYNRIKNRNELDRLLAEVRHDKMRMAEIDSLVSAKNQVIDQRIASIDVSKPGDLVKDECIDWALKSWIFLGIGGLVCAAKNSAEASSVASKMRTQHAENMQPLIQQQTEMREKIRLKEQRIQELREELK